MQDPDSYCNVVISRKVMEVARSCTEPDFTRSLSEASSCGLPLSLAASVSYDVPCFGVGVTEAWVAYGVT